MVERTAGFKLEITPTFHHYNPSITLRPLFRHAKKDDLALFAAHVYEGSAS